VSVAAIVETLAREFSVERAHAERVHELLTAGYKAPYIARYRRAEVGNLTDGAIRRFARRLKQFEELEGRRATLLRSIEEQSQRHPEAACDEASLASLRACMDRFELEDHFLPHRRPEPEVQLAIDRGLEPLADALVAPPARTAAGQDEEEPAPEVESPAEPPCGLEEQITLSSEASTEGTPEPTGEGLPPESQAEAQVEESEPEPEPAADETALARAEDEGEAGGEERRPPEPSPHHRPTFHPARIDLSPQLARLCAPFVNPDRGVHTDEQALEGAMRILSDRLGRNPELRTQLRRILRKHGRVSVRALVDEQRLGRSRSLLRLDSALRQLQGHRLIALRQAQGQRLIALSISVDEALVLPKVRAALGRRIQPEFASVADEVARQALHLRLLPMIEDDVRNELRERADEEAIRLLAQNLRQILLAPPAGPYPAAGVHVDARGDWTLVKVGAQGEPQGPELKIEASSLALTDLALKLRECMQGSGIGALALGHGKESRPALHKLREAIQTLGAEANVFLVNEAGLSYYANSELARSELPDFSVPGRQAISLARRYQDPLQELLKIEPRHLGLGREQSVATKASLRRVVHDTIESCVAHVACELNRAPLTFLRHVPGLSFELARKLVERRAERPFGSREELRTERLLDDVAWVNAIGFLRVEESSEPLDRTTLHPEQYDLARRIVLQGGGSVEETLGQRDATRGLRRADFELDELTWRDLVREIAHPGRDPRPRQLYPRMLSPDFDLKTLQKEQVVEGVVSNVASFGAFVDLGPPRDALIHISEISSHYVRDARALLAVGQVVRARVVAAGGPRVELSLKNVPDSRRQGGPVRPHAQRDARPAGEPGERSERPGRGRRPRRERGEESWPEYQPVLRAARSRRDGLVTGQGDERRRGRGGRDGGRSSGRPGGGAAASGAGRRPGGGAGRDEHYDPEAVRRASNPAGSYNPFASFFKEREPAPEPPSEEREQPGAPG
jgi:uncharacterized protein